MPEVDYGKHILDWFFELGLCGYSGMGRSPLSWQDLTAWQNITCVEISPWEARVIKSLSHDYISYISSYEDPIAPPPMLAKDVDAKAVSDKIKKTLSGFVKDKRVNK